MPVPVPSLLTARLRGSRANVAVTDWAALIVTVHVVALPAGHPPPVKPVKVDPVVGFAVRVTIVPSL